MLAEEIDRDYYLYNGGIERSHVLPFIEQISSTRAHDSATLLLVTPGGNPDAAYKIARYFQDSFESFSLCLPGYCKSAGTLIATGADELAFSPYGELGPLDIQLSKRDDLMGMESGLNISEAFISLEHNVRQTFNSFIMDILRNSGGVISFQTASETVADVISGIYGPVYAQIEPDEVGSRARAMRIGQEYAMRLNERFRNTSTHGITELCQMYPSHGFVIDQYEASNLFTKVRNINDFEKTLIDKLGLLARHPGETLVTEHLNGILTDGHTGENDHGAPEEDAAHAADHGGQEIADTGGNPGGDAGQDKSATGS